jgi:hypothetical protein
VQKYDYTPAISLWSKSKYKVQQIKYMGLIFKADYLGSSEINYSTEADYLGASENYLTHKYIICSTE